MWEALLGHPVQMRIFNYVTCSNIWMMSVKGELYLLYKFIKPLERIELSTLGLEDQCSYH